ncbi:MAG: hypothetical protein A3F33_00420 [Candidatus Woykebacteria bacterium RIFCSPHIGHO2_12_FULL_43_10]|uniref:Large ribosomal subunit protein bL25 n=2 Tax=Candidatus Woykeibacteriota TaxID=1817899 RepID=A0A1G1WXZ7_9BACT|nr:MAG: hypothetical protein A3J50_02105 [Candidatus Woykebacteria bacterium RIFCSPHIGHO2_02_FULL_43_16b]OGY28877.1 MAG: hypothetical protein A3F33_00420 [Candidatus Woykebacteria bacterium RIFCSPHIGHO2_12_FULL_43_10]OGY32599.1 MAG: hypothetical protein A3A61_03745 [Candidatus Woykebacteria bacterium RIFCSPLOWO2_01_FULL_43_14]
MENIKLEAQERTVLGKQVKRLRREGLIPANIFGKDVKSESIQLKAVDFLKAWKKAGETTLIELSIGETKSKPVFVRGMHRDPKSNKILHADFQQVNLKEKITAMVPLILDGEAPIEKSGEGLILQTLSEVEVEALPTEVPHEIKVGISALTEVGQTIQVKDLPVPSGAEIKTDPEASVVSVQTAEMKEEVGIEEVAPGEPEVLAEKPEGVESGEGGESTGAKESKEDAKE